MKCPECEKEGKRSTVRGGGGFSTAMGVDTFYDEDGKYHRHDPNYTTMIMTCSNGHEWDAAKPHKCPAEGCDFMSGGSYTKLRQKWHDEAAAKNEK